MKAKLPAIIISIMLIALLIYCVIFVIENISDSPDKSESSEALMENPSENKENQSAPPLSELPNETTNPMTQTTVHTHKGSGMRTVTIEPSCITSGKRDTIECCDCGFEMSVTTEELPPKGHSYKSEIIKPTCIENGYTRYICSICQDSYTENSEELLAIGHSFSNGICTKCRIEDPNYVKVYSSKEIIEMLDASIVNSTGYRSYTGNDSISVFAKERWNCFSMSMAVSYNLWGHEVQSVTFNVEDIAKKIPTLYFNVGGQTGSDGTILVEFFVDTSTDGQPTQSFEIECSSYPILSSINIDNAKSLTIRVRNRSNNENRIVFFDFSSAPQ